MSSNLVGKRVMITGASSGIGAETAKLIANTGAELILCASNKKSLEKIHLNGPQFYKTAFDLAEENSILKAYEQIVNEFGAPDILINNAGVGLFNSVEKFKLEDFDKTMAVNFRAPYMLTKLVLPRMLENKSGTIVNILSVVARTVYANSSVYGASKAALAYFSEVLRKETRESGISVINIYPGATATPIWNPNALEKHGERMMPPSEVAKAIFIALDMNLAGKLAVEDITLRPPMGDL